MEGTSLGPLAELSSRERVARTLSLEEPDRVPVMDTLLPGFVRRYLGKRRVDASTNLQDHFGFDIRTVSCRFTPSLIQHEVLEKSGETEIFRDRWGLVVRRWSRREGVPQVIRPAIETEDDLEEYFHDPEDPARFEGLRESVRDIHDRAFPAILTFSDQWGGLYHIFGLKGLLRLIHGRPRLVRRAIRMLTKHYVRVMGVALDQDLDGVWFFGDLAGNSGPFISPKIYRSLFLEAHRAVFKPWRSRGLPVIFHSDGDIRLIIPSMIEEGVTALQPLDAMAGLDVVRLKEEYGDRLAFIGNVPNKTLLPRGTPRDIALDVRRRLQAGEGGGYILGSSHSIAEDVPPSNFEAMLRAGRKYGRYPLA
jgi:uroporphyrinogen decarboxylase